MNKYMIANITWNSTGWVDVSHEKSNFGWVKKHPRSAPGESWNFSFSSTSKVKKGFFEVRDEVQPKKFQDGGIVFFFSRNIPKNKNYLVGIYANARYVGKKWSSNYLYNLVAPNHSCLKFYNYIHYNRKRHLPPKRIRIPRLGYTYITETNARNILTDALKENSIINGIEENSQPKSDYFKLSRIAKKYFRDIAIPKFRLESDSKISLTDFAQKEFPDFSSDDRITITKNNAKLKRSYIRHQDLLNRAIENFKESGWREMKIASNADLFAAKGRTIAILEVKSINSKNLVHQIRIGISQLFNYAFELHKKGYQKQRLILLLERQPDRKWLEFCDYCNVELWYKENKIIIPGLRNSI